VQEIFTGLKVACSCHCSSCFSRADNSRSICL